MLLTPLLQLQDGTEDTKRSTESEIYIPKPINTSEIELPNRLLPLVELMAQNMHENW